MTPEQTPITPELLAAAIVPMAASHGSGLQQSVEGLRLRVPTERQPITEEAWRWVFQELLAAHFCLVSPVCVLRAFPDISDRNLYGQRMLWYLRSYPEPEGTLVGNAFSSERFLAEAFRWYIEGIPELDDSDEMRGIRRSLSVDRNNTMSEFTLKIHLRVTRLLKIQGKHPEYTMLFVHNASAVIAAAQTYAQWQPVFDI